MRALLGWSSWGLRAVPTPYVHLEGPSAPLPLPPSKDSSTLVFQGEPHPATLQASMWIGGWQPTFPALGLAVNIPPIGLEKVTHPSRWEEGL